ncbi:MAG: ankyrin repeat domain-containing protein [Chloroflexota bacterium]|nr:ankyrin repeat domain-containing protein [Chloroflexota bacterium]
MDHQALITMYGSMEGESMKDGITKRDQDLDQEIVEGFVVAAHASLWRVKELYALEPEVLNAVWARFNETALQAASHMGQREIAEFLLAEGAPLDICAAAMLGRKEDVARFLAEDPSLSRATGAHGITLMYHAALGGKPEVCEMLVRHGGAEGMDGALHAAVKSAHLGMVKWLLDNGVKDVNIGNFDGKTPLAMAIQGGHKDIAALIEERGGVEEVIG